MMLLQYLPEEIILEILARLPFEYVIKCKEVCKTWRDILHPIKRDEKVNFLIAGNHDFGGIKFYHGEYDEKNNKKIHEKLSFNALKLLGYPNVKEYHNTTYCPMVGSHKGLVCLHVTHNNDPILISNPLTQETVRLPLFDVPKYVNNYSLVIGFGYLYASNEYKIVGIYYNEDNKFCKGQVQVYTLGDKSGWRNKGNTDHHLSESNGILSNGALHWVDDTGLQILAFSLADEEFRSFPAPPHFPVKYYHGFSQLVVLRGNLSMVCRGISSTDVWSLKETKNKNGHLVKVQWSHEFTLPKHLHHNCYHPFAVTEDSKVLMSKKNWWYQRDNTLCHYDSKTAALEESADAEIKKFSIFQVIRYMKSDVSLTALVPDLPVVGWLS